MKLLFYSKQTLAFVLFCLGFVFKATFAQIFDAGANKHAFNGSMYTITKDNTKAYSFTALTLLFSACIGRTYRAVLLVSLLCFFGPAAALYAQTQFITKWDLSKTGASTTALTFGVAVASTGAATYTWNTVPAGTSGSGTIAASAISVTISGLPANAIIEVKINPTNFQRININNGADRARLVDVSQWGTTAWTSMATAFNGCNNLNITATDVPTLTSVTNMSSMFPGCTLLNGPSNIGAWTTTAVTNMSSMFSSATAFNQNISTWNTAAVTTMSFMFSGATAFNQNIGAWNVAGVTNMSSMFGGATAFNQSLATWGTKFNASVVLANCLDNCGMSMTNYEATLAGFALTTHRQKPWRNRFEILQYKRKNNTHYRYTYRQRLDNYRRCARLRYC